MINGPAVPPSFRRSLSSRDRGSYSSWLRSAAAGKRPDAILKVDSAYENLETFILCETFRLLQIMIR